MKFFRIFSGTAYKGTKNYINTQKKYVIIRTILLFLVSLSLFLIGYISTKTNKNLLTIIAVLGCLPASKSAVEMIMFLRFKSSPKDIIDKIEKYQGNLTVAYDMIFTTYEKNFYVDHIAIAGNTVCGFTSNTKTDTDLCEKHILSTLKLDGHKNVSVKIFQDLNKYTDRLSQMQTLDNTTNNNEILSVVLSVTL